MHAVSTLRWKPLIISILIPLAVGGLSAFVTRDGMEVYGSLNQPPLSPPGWLFPVVWTILFLLMGISSYLVYVSDHSGKRTALTLYGVQLVFNFLWSVWFFNLGAYEFAFFWLIFLWLLILAMIVQFYRVNRNAALLQLPYLIWVAFAGYLNAGVWLLNR